MIHFPALRWGTPYRSLDIDKVVHFDTGEPVAEVSQANPGIVARAISARRPAPDRCSGEVHPADLVQMVKKAAELFLHRRAAARRGHADAGRVRPAAVRHYRAPPSTCAG